MEVPVRNTNTPNNHSNSEPNFSKKIYIIIMVATLLFFAIGVLLLVNTLAVENSDEYAQVEATITHIDTTWHGDNKDYIVFVSYTVDGQQYENQLGEYSSTMNVGDKINIYYLKSNPNVIKSSGISKLLAIIFMAFSIIVAIGTTVFFIIMNKKNKKDTLAPKNTYNDEDFFKAE